MNFLKAIPGALALLLPLTTLSSDLDRCALRIENIVKALSVVKTSLPTLTPHSAGVKEWQSSLAKVEWSSFGTPSLVVSILGGKSGKSLLFNALPSLLSPVSLSQEISKVSIDSPTTRRPTLLVNEEVKEFTPQLENRFGAFDLWQSVEDAISPSDRMVLAFDSRIPKSIALIDSTSLDTASEDGERVLDLAWVDRTLKESDAVIFTVTPSNYNSQRVREYLKSRLSTSSLPIIFVEQGSPSIDYSSHFKNLADALGNPDQVRGSYLMSTESPPRLLEMLGFPNMSDTLKKLRNEKLEPKEKALLKLLPPIISSAQTQISEAKKLAYRADLDKRIISIALRQAARTTLKQFSNSNIRRYSEKVWNRQSPVIIRMLRTIFGTLARPVKSVRNLFKGSKAYQLELTSFDSPMNQDIVKKLVHDAALNLQYKVQRGSFDIAFSPEQADIKNQLVKDIEFYRQHFEPDYGKPLSGPQMPPFENEKNMEVLFFDLRFQTPPDFSQFAYQFPNVEKRITATVTEKQKSFAKEIPVTLQNYRLERAPGRNFLSYFLPAASAAPGAIATYFVVKGGTFFFSVPHAAEQWHPVILAALAWIATYPLVRFDSLIQSNELLDVLDRGFQKKFENEIALKIGQELMQKILDDLNPIPSPNDERFTRLGVALETLKAALVEIREEP